MSKRKEATLSTEERLKEALVPDWEQPYKLPENWCWVTLANVSEIIMGQSPSGIDTTDDNSYLPLIGGAADMGALYPDATRYTKVPTKISTEKDIILCIRATLGKPIYSNGKYCLGRGVAAIRPIIGTREFYRYFFLNFEQYLYDNATGTTFAQVNSLTLQGMPFPLPPLAEQQRIVDRIESLFSKLDEAKEKSQAVVDSFETRKAAILHKAFTGELTAQWRNKHGVSLKSWDVVPFEKIIIDGPQNGLYKPKTVYGQGIKILRIDCFYDGYVEPWDILKRLTLSDEEISLYKLRLNDIVVNRVNSMAYLGKSALIRTLPETCVFESNMMRLSLDCEKAVPEYIITYLNSTIGLTELRKNAKQAVNQASINQQDVKKVIIKLPLYAEQEAIAEVVRNLVSKEQRAKEIAENILKQINLIKKSILARAFRGELGTNDPIDENAVELLKDILSNGPQKKTETPRKKTASIPASILRELSSDLEKEIIRLYFRMGVKSLPIANIMAIRSQKFEIMECLRTLEQKKVIEKNSNGEYVLLR